MIWRRREARHSGGTRLRSVWSRRVPATSRKQERERAMNIEHFTEKAREALSDAAQLARQYHHNQVEVEHLLADLLDQEGGVVKQVIAKVGGDLAAARRILDNELERMPYVYGGNEPAIAPILSML